MRKNAILVRLVPGVLYTTSQPNSNYEYIFYAKFEFQNKLLEFGVSNKEDKKLQIKFE